MKTYPSGQRHASAEGSQTHNGQWLGGPHRRLGHVPMGGIPAPGELQLLAAVLTGTVEGAPVFNYACGSDVIITPALDGSNWSAACPGLETVSTRQMDMAAKCLRTHLDTLQKNILRPPGIEPGLLGSLTP
jgi:hypothetical protein